MMPNMSITSAKDTVNANIPLKILVIFSVFVTGTVIIWFFDDKLAQLSDKFLLVSGTDKLIVTVEFLLSVLISNAIIDIVWSGKTKSRQTSAHHKKTALEIARQSNKVSPEFLLKLINVLRMNGFTVGTDQACSAYDVVLAKVADKRNPFTLDHYKFLLAPIFCASPGGQELFYRIFTQCVSEHYSGTSGAVSTNTGSQLSIARHPAVINGIDFWSRFAVIFIVAMLCLYALVNLNGLLHKSSD